MKRAEAWEMFKSGTQKKAIAEALGVHRKTVSRWAKADQWEERLKAIRQEATQIRDEEAVEETVELLKKVDHGLGFALDQIPKSDVRDLANTGRAVDHLTKARERLGGKSEDDEKRPEYAPITLQNIVLAVRGGPGAPGVDPSAVRQALEFGGIDALDRLIKAGVGMKELRGLGVIGEAMGYQPLTQAGLVCLAGGLVGGTTGLDPLEVEFVAREWALSDEKGRG